MKGPNETTQYSKVVSSGEFDVDYLEESNEDDELKKKQKGVRKIRQIIKDSNIIISDPNGKGTDLR